MVWSRTSLVRSGERAHDVLGTLRLLGVVTLCLGGTAASAETVVTVQYPYPSLSRPVHDEIARRFAEIRPDVTIEYLRPAENHNEALQYALRTSMTGTMPDVSFQGTHLGRTLVARGLAQPLTGCLGPDTEALGYADWALDMGTIDGEIYGFPYGLTAPVLFINQDLLQRAGVETGTPPDTWEELMAIGARVEALDDSYVGLHYIWNLTGDFMFQTLLFSRGGSMLSPDETRVAFDAPAGVEALETIAAFGRSGMPYMSFPQVNQAFAAGTVGIMVNTTAFVSGLEREIGDRFTMALWPFPRDADGRLPSGGNIPMVLSTDPAKQDAICDYIRFVTGPVGQTIMVERIGYLTGNDLALTDARYLQDYVDSNAHYAWTLQQLPVLTNWYAFPGDHALEIMDAVHDAMEAVFTGTATAEEAMPRMAGHVQALIEH